jgi:SAM-dependent methyltransferase
MEIISLGNQTSVGFTDKPEDGVKVPLDLVLCIKCHLLQLKYTTNPDLLYNENYGYRSGVNETMREELADIVDTAVTFGDDIAVDIGCNDGTLLSNYPRDVVRVGFDPSLGTNLNTSNNLAIYCQENLSTGGARYKIFAEYFNAEKFKSFFGKRKASVVTAIAMFYDLDDPNEFLQDVKEILDDDGTLIIQQNYLVGMLKNVAFDNVCHEHLEYFSLTALESLLDRNGFEVVDVEEREINGGSFRTYIQKKGTFRFVNPSVKIMRQKELEMGLNTTVPYFTFASKVQQLAEDLRQYIEKKVKEGKKVYVYGASTRGNSLLQVAKIDYNLISGAAERNPTKYGKYTAGTKIKIVSEEEARKKADIFLCLPWFFRDSFIKREKEFIKKGKHLIFPLPKITII